MRVLPYFYILSLFTFDGPARGDDAVREIPITFSRRCTICHGQTIPFEDLGQLKSMPPSFETSINKTFSKEIIRRINPEADPKIRMPFNQDPLEETEIKLIREYLGE